MMDVEDHLLELSTEHLFERTMGEVRGGAAKDREHDEEQIRTSHYTTWVFYDLLHRLPRDLLRYWTIDKFASSDWASIYGEHAIPQPSLIISLSPRFDFAEADPSIRVPGMGVIKQVEEAMKRMEWEVGVTGQRFSSDDEDSFTQKIHCQVTRDTRSWIGKLLLKPVRNEKVTVSFNFGDVPLTVNCRVVEEERWVAPMDGHYERTTRVECS